MHYGGWIHKKFYTKRHAEIVKFWEKKTASVGQKN